MVRRDARKGPNWFYIALAIVALVGIGVIAWSMINSKETTLAPLELPADSVADGKALVAMARGVERGPDNAPLQLLVFSDFMCPACAHFATLVEPNLKREYIDTGKLQLVYRDYPLTEIHKWAFVAARAARCADDQGKFWEYHDRLFSMQREWSVATEAPIKQFRDYASSVGIDGGAFNKCLEGDTHAQLVTANRALGEQVGVQGTPTLFLNGQHLPTEWQDYNALKQRIDAILPK